MLAVQNKNSNVSAISAIPPIPLNLLSCFTELLTVEKHCQVHHNGVTETLSAIREHYWIIRGRELVKKVIRRCVLRQKYEGKPYATAPVPPLPLERVSSSPPFNNTGLDFAGPLYIWKSQLVIQLVTQSNHMCVFSHVHPQEEYI